MGARPTPAEDLAPPGRQIREAREKLKLSTDAFGQLLSYDGSHIRGVELGKTGYGRVAQRCGQVAQTCDSESTAKALSDLAEFLHAFKADVDSKTIDTRRGTERKQNQGRAADHLVGDWCAIWQTCRNGDEVLVAETVVVTASGNGRLIKMANCVDSRRLKMEQSGGFENPGTPNHLLEWTAGCRITKDGRWISGEFSSRSIAKIEGLFRLRLDNFPEAMVGDWLGDSWDSERTHGLLVMARSKALAEMKLTNERGRASGLPHFLN